MTCVILRAEIRGANTNKRRRERERESEMMRECYEEERKEASERRGGAKGGIVGGRRTGNEGWTVQGRGRAETLKWFETGSRTVAHFDPSVGGERVTVRALAAEDSWVLVTGVRGEAAR
ncbi:hypothetical protein ALC62_13020 [Cyphomyrmex costatus]|uniref:Uncharacterized protein n=1 Tax=Cyphomyrmex costatus TaxID=456900 RepID=A0A195C8A8_9HYME|nr:hypothetical protein ALC62_13020 [Cyphomyrmex costatus]